VGSCDVKFPIRLEGLAYSHGHFSSVRKQWRMEQWRMEQWRMEDQDH
jgi:hypothetical protein